MSRSAKKAAFDRCSETCPAVEKAVRAAIGGARLGVELSWDDARTLTTDVFDAARTAGTEPLREALIACEEERDDMETERDAAKSEADDLREQVSALEKKLEEAEALAADSSLSDGK
jgi:uncharacterized protein (DUF3084 family)